MYNLVIVILFSIGFVIGFTAAYVVNWVAIEEENNETKSIQGLFS